MKIRDEAFQYYFHFMQERMNIFWQRNSESCNLFSNLTEDPILSEYKFTNVYRVCDRVSQYLIRNVIYSTKENFSAPDTILRVLLFKIFNRVDTWEFIERKLGNITTQNFNITEISKILSERIKERPIFSAAYLMTGTHHNYTTGYSYKHEKWLQMLKTEIINEPKIDKMLNCKTLKELYEFLIGCSFIGPFLAYQYAIDLNYSDVFDFDENSFVMAGIGAIRGIKKCFSDLNGYSYEDAIHYTAENIEKYREKYGYSFNNLFDRQPTLIDLQNCFCETDKYLRVKLPELSVGNKRIKQKFKMNPTKIDLFFPPKWNLSYPLENQWK